MTVNLTQQPHSGLIQGYSKDPWFTDSKHLTQLVERRGLYLKHAAVAIPNHVDLRQRSLHGFHNTPYAGHLGVARTTKLIENWWPTLRADVLLHVRPCRACQRDRGAAQRSFGEPQPLAAPDYQWKDTSMDFITHLPSTRSGFTSIMVVVDRLTKMVHFLCTYVAALFRDGVFCLHAMPQFIVSDRDVKFTSAFWT